MQSEADGCGNAATVGAGVESPSRSLLTGRDGRGERSFVQAGQRRELPALFGKGSKEMNTGVTDRFLEVFTRYIDSGFGLLGGEVAFLATTLVAIDVTLAALFWSWS